MIGGLILKAALGTAWEGAVGRFTAGRLFGPLVMALGAIPLYFGVTKGIPAMVVAHDMRVSRQAEAKYAMSVQLELQKAKTRALEEAVAKGQETLKAREGDLTALREVVEKTEKENRDVRDASPNGTAVVIPADDPWLRPRKR